MRLAEEGADVIAFDVIAPVEAQGAPAATPEDLAETVRLVEKLDRRIVSAPPSRTSSRAAQARS